MNCEESSELIIERAAGRLGNDRAAELAEHIEGCNNCRFELEATQWLARKLHGHNKRTDAGHVSIPLLFKYVEDPESFDEDTIETMWEHLDTCDACVDDYDYLKDLIAVPPEKRRAFALAIAESEESSAAARGEIADAENDEDTWDEDTTAQDTTDDDLKDDGTGGDAEEADAGGAPGEIGSSPARDTAPSSARAKIGATEATHATVDAAHGSRPTLTAADPHVTIDAAETPSESIDAAAPHVTIDAAETPRETSGAPDDTSATATSVAPPPEPPTAKKTAPGARPPKPGSAWKSSSKSGAAKGSPSGNSGTKTAGSGSAKPLSGARSHGRAKSSGRLGPVRDFFAGIATAIVNQPRNAAIAGGGIIIGLIVVISLMNSAGVVGSSTVAHWETSDVFSTTTPVQEVPIALVRRGRTRPVSGDIDLGGIGSLVIAVDLDPVDGAAMNYDAVIIDPQDKEIFRDRIDTGYFMEGRLLLRLESKHFRSGEYGLVIDSTDRGGIVRTIARGTIYVTR
jgi:hypothetical protein